MIDFELAQMTFREYLKNYNNLDGKIKLKITHTYEVVTMSEYISKDLKLDSENILLAKLIALLHDIGRFEQLRKYDDYRDYTTIDHADLGVQILFKDGRIRTFITDDQYDSIISKSIRNHNKLKIEGRLSASELLHAKIIRDADKTDNFRVKATDKFENIFHSREDLLMYDTISLHIYENFMDHKLIVSEERKTDMDCWVSYLAFIFDFNFNSGLKYIKGRDYVNKLVDRIDYQNSDTKKKMENIRKCAIEYIEKKLQLE